MTNNDRTEKRYIVWHNEPDVQTPRDGIEKVIESIVRTGAEYGVSVDDTKMIVRGAAIEYFDMKDFNPITGAKPGSAEHRQAVQEFGQRAVYELQVRHVGYVDAEGKFRDTRKKKQK